MSMKTQKAGRVVTLWVDRNTIDMRVTTDGNLHVQRARWHSWVGVMTYLRRFDPAIYDLTVRVKAGAAS